MYSASKVFALLEGLDKFEVELGEQSSLVDLDGESEDEDKPERDGSLSDDSQILLDAKCLVPDSGVYRLH